MLESPDARGASGLFPFEGPSGTRTSTGPAGKEFAITEDERGGELADIHGELDLHRPNAARMYDYFLGGTQNFPADRGAARKQLELLPETRVGVLENRSFLRRVVRFCVERGIRQFLDLGSGIPTVGNVHEVAHQGDPDAVIAYVDHEPVAVAHARRLLQAEPRVSVTQADLAHPADVLAAAGVRRLLDLREPVAVLALSVLHFIPDESGPTGVLATYRDACAPGSVLAVSHASGAGLTSTQVVEGLRIYDRTPTPLSLRPAEQAGELMAGWALVPPGVVPVVDWRPDVPVGAEVRAAVGSGWSAVGVRPSARS
ncbi:SAM-dependent methyltransferase [Saccharopolyspora gregorii]|uniref:SAM-dependent methyltransferase n=1 Tax=Saccharopolyspora gregorii TaxID=33914 RepID=A0ABP6RQQ5_9PSEU|nr:SAM-dependent methyltransferase [Saccharopolyspora gregorii]